MKVTIDSFGRNDHMRWISAIEYCCADITNELHSTNLPNSVGRFRLIIDTDDFVALELIVMIAIRDAKGEPAISVKTRRFKFCPCCGTKITVNNVAAARNRITGATRKRSEYAA